MFTFKSQPSNLNPQPSTLNPQLSTLKYQIALAFLLSVCLTVEADPITKAEARQVVESLVGIDDSSDDNVPVAPYYIFSRGAGQGYVIASGDDSTAPILGYTEQGDYDAAALPPQLQSMLTLWHQRIGEVQRRPQTQRQRISAPRRAIADFKKEWTSVAPLLKTHWHQSTPYNNLAPIKEGKGRCMSGCVATAGSQVTYYFHKDNPGELAYNTPTYSYGTPITVSLPKGTPIEWNLMKLSGTGTAKQDSAVAKLMYALGTSAWLTYGDGDGTATSGYNDKMAEAMKGQFRLNYSYKSKSEYSQQKWEELIYKNLSEKRPMLYSGYKDEETGGHSVCLDGYQASTGLYHFNFGWGGQGDGYYTVDDATGMNGFNSYQDLVFNITPQIQNLKATTPVTQFYHKAKTDVEVTVTNDGTLDYQGIYIYLGTREDKVTTSAVGYDLKTVIETGKDVTLTFPVTPTTTNGSFLQICDKSRHIITAVPIEIVSTVADLHLDTVTVDASSVVETLDGMEFLSVNNTSATVTVTLTNGYEGTFCQPTLQCYLQSYDSSTQRWTNVTNTTVNTLTFDKGQTQAVDFKFNNLKDGSHYRAYLSDKAMASLQSEIQMDGHSPYVYFTVHEATLNVAIDGRNATVTGRWNATLFAQQATDATVCSYDISELADLDVKPVAANPNAIFYTTAENTALAGIENVVVGDVCQKLSIQTGADFKPSRPFTAKEATLLLTEAEPGKWHGTLIPFAADVPYGMQMKKAAEFSTSGLATVNHEATRRVEAMDEVTFLTSRKGLDTITATDAAITTDTVATFFDGLLQASTLATELKPQSLVLGEYAASLYFVAPSEGQTTLDAFQPVIVGTTENRVRTTSETLVDGYYRSLSITINEAYDTLTAHPGASLAAVEALQAEITTAQDMLTYRTHKENTDVKTERGELVKAINAFLEAADKEPVTGDVNGDGTVDVADIATIISVMASVGGDPVSARNADVNGDGSVDVADIATVISIMAAKSNE